MNHKMRYHLNLILIITVLFGLSYLYIELSKGNVFMAEEETFSTDYPKNDDVMLIDDFSKEDNLSSLGTSWQTFTDRVMGGISSAQHTFDDIKFNCNGNPQKVLNLKGVVSLDNNGGFAQAALALDPNQGHVDASVYSGVRIHVKGNGKKYYIHLRTNQTRLPWQYYSAEFIADEDWKTVEIPFTEFSAESINVPLNLKAIKRIALVAAKAAYQADVTLSRIEFYS